MPVRNSATSRWRAISKTGSSGYCRKIAHGHIKHAAGRVTKHERDQAMDLMTTIAGSMMEGFLPAGWDLPKIDRLGALGPDQVSRREKWWHAQFEPVACGSYADFDTFMGHEIAREIQQARQAERA